ncbi:hypothetical protein [Cyclobacterium amurskyense]|uniref:Gram-positive cocci surface proteins LPxTG domain-containing protein n=1 Tax=Cyclobacterium amurskyense TaxID=320787 RepID=A0A0H4PAS2_9BACT|nr:hypothetical protein [Cyclobacterium amurskyense]AKP50240.1 hypothetical protein CA2015_0781 [Cyclobacterium amurskyense]
MEGNLSEILSTIIALIIAIIGGSWYSKRKKKSISNIQKGIKIKGDKNKIVGGDDKSIKL